MTRVNVGIPPAELCDQHLLAEYRELPRVFAVDPKGAPALPCLGKGHVKWCATKPRSMALRFDAIVTEMLHRGYKPQHHHAPPHLDTETWTVLENGALLHFYLSMQDRIVDRLRTMKRKPAWTNRERPAWAEVTQ